MIVGSGEQKGAVPPWIFKHGTDVVDSGLIVLFSVFFAIFLLFFFRCPPLLENFLPTPLLTLPL